MLLTAYLIRNYDFLQVDGKQFKTGIRTLGPDICPPKCTLKIRKRTPEPANDLGEVDNH